MSSKYIASILLASLLVGCGGGGESSSPQENGAKRTKTKGYLIDSPIQGATYKNNEKVAKTGVGGDFIYEGGDISFYIGDIKLGSLNSLPKDNIVTLQDILHLQRDDLQNPTLLKVATFIQSIDEDKSTQAIEIFNDDKFRASKYQKDIKELDLKAILDKNALHVKDKNEVKNHLSRTYEGIVQDVSAPQIKSTFPSNGQKDIDVNSKIKITFSKNMPLDIFSKNSVLLKDNNFEFIPAIILADKNTLTIIPKKPLKVSQRYSVSLSEDIKDYQNNSIDSYSFHFTTKEGLNTQNQENQNTQSNQNQGSQNQGSQNQGSQNTQPQNQQESQNTQPQTTPQGDIVFKGLAYNFITSPITNKIWLDRNLGAKKVCENKGDEQCYGDYYQWGRAANGHEKKDSQVIDAVRQGYNGIVQDVSENAKFATWKDDWRSTKDDTLWQGVNGKNNPCPSGFKVPSIDEIMAETKEVDKQAFANEVLDGHSSNLTNFLKLPNNGYRKYKTRDGILDLEGFSGNIWSSTVNDVGLSYKFDFTPSGSWKSPVARAFGFGVRCIKDYEDNVALEVLDTYPSKNDTDIEINTNFRVVFSKQVSDVTRKHFTIRRKADGKESSISTMRKKTKNIVEFYLERSNSNASGGLEYDTEYELVINTSLHDVSNNYLLNEYIVSFKTKAKK